MNRAEAFYQVQGVSLPRSGHHLLARMISHFFGDDIYCDFYGCCQSMPCETGAKFQKHHDLSMNLAISDQQRYAIQFRRDPQAQFEAYFRFFRQLYQNGDQRFPVQDHFPYFQDYYSKYFLDLPNPDNCRRSYDLFVTDHLPYYRGFVEKWLAHPPRQALCFAYEDLISSPMTALKSVAKLLSDDPVPPEAFETSVASQKVGMKHHLEASPLFDPEFCARFEITDIQGLLSDL